MECTMLLTWFNAPVGRLYQIPTTSGLYIFTIQTHAGNTPIYVGKAKNLYERMCQHVSNSEQNLDLKSYINNYPGIIRVYWAQAPYSNDLDRMELYLFRRYNPYCNRIEPSADRTLVCNLP